MVQVLRCQLSHQSPITSSESIPSCSSISAKVWQPAGHRNHHLRIPFGHPDRLGRPHHCESLLAECIADLGQGHSCSLRVFVYIVRHCRNTNTKLKLVKRGTYGSGAICKFQGTGLVAGRLNGCFIHWYRGNAVLQCLQVSFRA
jgi:hypothetical protein